MLVVCCVFSNTNNDDHGSRRGHTVQALAQWQHLVASCEATVALHQAMWLTPYHSGGMVIKIAVELGTFVNITDKSTAWK